MSFLRKCDAALMGLIVLTLVVSVFIAIKDPQYFARTFAAEDHLVENATCLFLLVAAGVLGSHAVSPWRAERKNQAILMTLYAFVFVMGAGEEISWGQRIFGWESGEFFQEHNKQVETNLHNMIVGDVQLTKTLFGPVLTLCILLYLALLPLLYSKFSRAASLADRMVVPVPWPRHGVIAIITSVIIAMLVVGRKWEVYELIFSLLAVSVFILPQNRQSIRQRPKPAVDGQSPTV